MTQPAYRITTAPSRPKRRGGVLRGLAAVAVLFITAADALATALIGIPPVAWLCRQLAAVITATYRRAAGRPSSALVITGRVIPPDRREEDADGHPRR